MNKKVQAAINGFKVTPKYKSYVVKQAELMTSLGIEDEISLRKFHHISRFVPIFVRRATYIHNPEIYTKVIRYVFDNRASVNNVEDLRTMVIEALAEQTIVKKAYPQSDNEYDVIPSYDTQKWIKAKSDIDLKKRLFRNVNPAYIVQEVTKGWSEMEINKFNDWVRFYEEGGHAVYKTANSHTFYTKDNTFPLQPVPGLTKEEPRINEIELMKERAKKQRQEKLELLQKARNSLIGRISSAKKILSSEIGQTLVGDEYEKLLRTLMQVEESLLTLKTSKLVPDVLARAENSLKKCGYDHAAFIFNKIAQENPDVKNAIIETLNDATSWSEKNLMPSNKELKDELEKEKQEPTDEVPVPEEEGANSDVPPPPPSPVTASYQWATYKTPELAHFEKIAEVVGQAIESAKSIHKLAQQIPAGTSSNATKFFAEDSLDKAFANIKLSDIIKRIQALVRVFKNREIARQLSIIDLMLDKLGIAGLFPQLAEATKSALESNQYSGTRVEEILGKLMSMSDEGGNLNAQLGKEIKPSLIDDEMQKALQEPEIITPNKPAAPAIPAPPAAPIMPPAPPVPNQLMGV